MMIFVALFVSTMAILYIIKPTCVLTVNIKQKEFYVSKELVFLYSLLISLIIMFFMILYDIMKPNKVFPYKFR